MGPPVLSRPAVDQPLADRVCLFCDDLEREGRPDWQAQQAERAVRIYFLNFLQTTDAGWRDPPAGNGHQRSRPDRPRLGLIRSRGRVS